MRLLVTGGTGVLGRVLASLAEAAGHEFAMPGHEELDLFDPALVAEQQTERFARAAWMASAAMRALPCLSEAA